MHCEEQINLEGSSIFTWTVYDLERDLLGDFLEWPEPDLFLSRLLDRLSDFLGGEYLGEARDLLEDLDLDRLRDLLLSYLEPRSPLPSSSLTRI